MSEPTPARPQNSLSRAVSGQYTLMDAIGGRRGFIESAVPGLLFVIVFTVTRSLTPSLWVAMIAAAGLTVVRLVRRETVQHALGGFVGIAICAFIAQRSGKAEDFYLPGLLLNIGYAAAYLVSVLVRWPLLGVLIGPLNGEGFAWRRDPARLRAYTRASLIWVAMFLLRVVVQAPLYAAGAVTALGIARVAMGLPLFAVAGYLSYLVLKPVPPTRPHAVEGVVELPVAIPIDTSAVGSLDAFPTATDEQPRPQSPA